MQSTPNSMSKQTHQNGRNVSQTTTVQEIDDETLQKLVEQIDDTQAKDSRLDDVDIGPRLIGQILAAATALIAGIAFVTLSSDPVTGLGYAALGVISAVGSFGAFLIDRLEVVTLGEELDDVDEDDTLRGRLSELERDMQELQTMLDESEGRRPREERRTDTADADGTRPLDPEEHHRRDDVDVDEILDSRDRAEAEADGGDA